VLHFCGAAKTCADSGENGKTEQYEVDKGDLPNFCIVAYNNRVCLALTYFDFV
jgi:hypothetical protein